MSYTHKVTIGSAYNVDGTTVKSSNVTYTQTAGAENNLSESVTDGTDQLVAFVADVSQMKSFIVWSAGGNMTVETNNGTTPGNTLTLVDGVEQVWITGMPTAANPLTVDVTALYITNTGTATLNIRSLIDPTV